MLVAFPLEVFETWKDHANGVFGFSFQIYLKNSNINLFITY